ncbi:uncharacterized protein CMU_027750 [Cryptosporidium muris RN66]|uniref:Uncharacterized protein n=1 Tax=Cryptosporidium muris (strain RN66) TaxID=441375 RepID=B6ABL3_CRYMR|nr:uncharacterized protein CMU_027750 [Cryptosporidium muris RN66]EEA05765.1 hypothetical protein, conserved [Cryptosporidium muris RN66]|eukprot:XP_002140114.1 hypothetical protein [Cryptosporidium muris RN66]
MLKTDLNNEMISDVNYNFKIFDILFAQHDQTLTVSRLCNQIQFNSVQECREILKLYRESEQYGKYCELIYLITIIDDNGDNITMKVIDETDLSLYTSKIIEKFIYGIKQKNIDINDSIANNQVHFHLECEEIRRNILATKLLPNKLWISKYSLFRESASPKLRYSSSLNQDYSMINNNLDISKTELYPIISNNNSKDNTINTDPYPLSISLETNIDNSLYTTSNLKNDLNIDINMNNTFNENNQVYNIKDINIDDKRTVDIIMDESPSKISINNNENLLFNDESNDNLGSNNSNNSNLLLYSENEINNDNSLEKKSSKGRKKKSSLFDENNNIDNKKSIHYNKSKNSELSYEVLNKKKKVDLENKLDDNNEHKYNPQQVDAINLEKITRDKIYKDSKTGYLVVEDDVDFILSKEKSTYMTKKQTSNGHNKIIKSINNAKKHSDTKQQTLTSFFKVCK